MANRKWLGLIVLSVAAIVVLGVGLGVGLAGGSRASTEPSDEITKSVCQFEGVAVPDLRVVASPSGVNLITVISGETEYGFNPQSKKIELVIYIANLESDQTVLITQEEAQAIATAFAQKHCENLPIFALYRSELKNFGGYPDKTTTVMQAYEFEWIQVLDGALTPNSVLVDVNPGTGKVITYICRYQPLESGGPPSLTKEDAKTTVADRIAETVAESTKITNVPFGEVSFLEEPELRIVVKDGKQTLVWRVKAEAVSEDGDYVGGWYDIDALTGRIVEENPFL